MKKLKAIPKFKNEDAEREFWSTHDTTEYGFFIKVSEILTMPPRPIALSSG